MKIHNFLECKMHDEKIHEGKGICQHSTVFTGEEIEAPVSFINYTIIPPASSFGLHTHGKNNEFYVLLEGEGVYQQDGKEIRVKRGDIMMNQPYAQHCIYNTGKEDMKLLVFEVAIV